MRAAADIKRYFDTSSKITIVITAPVPGNCPWKIVQWGMGLCTSCSGTGRLFNIAEMTYVFIGMRGVIAAEFGGTPIVFGSGAPTVSTFTDIPIVSVIA